MATQPEPRRPGADDDGQRMVTKWLSVDGVVRDGAGGEGRETGQKGGRGGTLTLVASTGSEDRAGDVITASGWELATYRQNPVFLWAHDYRRPAIGRSVRTWVEEGPSGGRLMATIEFAPTPFAEEIRTLYAGGFMHGISVGFRALEMEPRTAAGGKRGWLFRRQELLEISAAPVPVNADALARDGMPSAAAVSAAPVFTGSGEPVLAGLLGEIRELWGGLAMLAGSPADVPASGLKGDL